MRLKNTFLPSALCFAIVLSSCATVKYKQEDRNKNFSHLNAGRAYKLSLFSGESKKMIFSNLTKDSIIGYTSKDGSGRVAISKDEVKSVRDVRKASTTTVGAGIGLAGVAGLVLSSMRASK